MLGHTHNRSFLRDNSFQSKDRLIIEFLAPDIQIVEGGLDYGIDDRTLEKLLKGEVVSIPGFYTLTLKMEKHIYSSPMEGGGKYVAYEVWVEGSSEELKKALHIAKKKAEQDPRFSGIAWHCSMTEAWEELKNIKETLLTNRNIETAISSMDLLLKKMMQ